MSRIQDILSKAERDGTARRTRALGDEYATRPGDEGVSTRGYGESGPASRGLDDGRARSAPETARVARPRRPDAPALPPPDPSAAAARREDPHAPASGWSAAHEATPRLMAQLDPHLVAALAPTSLAAEQYRSLRTRIKRSESGRALRTIAVTSPNKGDGKSLTAANLALTMAEEFQQRVLLLDCDLRRPSVHQLFGLAEAPGLGDVLMNAAELEHALVLLPEHHLTVLPAGLPPSNPAELIGSAAMRRVLDTLRTRFDRILIDVPPVAPLADLHILAPMVDALLMIVRAGVTPKPAIERALAGLDPTKVLGLVLNESTGQSDLYTNYEGYGYIAG
jgi:capsular exopolysaccharide synthesis family protein